jgi:hypothetical protein
LKVERLRRKRKQIPHSAKGAEIRDDSRVEAWVEGRKSTEPGWITTFLRDCAGALR